MLEQRPYYFFLTVWLLVSCSSLWAQSVLLTPTYEGELQEITTQPGAETCLTLSGLERDEWFELRVTRANDDSPVAILDLPPTADRISTGHVLSQGQRGKTTLCLGLPPSERPVALRVAVRKLNAAGEEKMMSLQTARNNDLNTLLNVVFRDQSCFELNPVDLRERRRTTVSLGEVAQIGTFSGGQDIIGLESGIIMTTGFTRYAGDANMIIPASGGYSTAPGMAVRDDDAEALIGNPNYFDAAVVEFTFVPTSDSISFDFVFFSEEYCSPTVGGPNGNDAFGFFLEGPLGRENIARLPGTDELINVSTLNHVITPDLFVDNVLPGDFLFSCTGIDPPAERLNSIAYNGFSRVLTAKAAVVPCEVHTLKFVVADAGDDVLDSGVFLGAGSFTAGLIGDPEPSVSGDFVELSTVEGCDTASLTFERLFATPAELAQPLKVSYNLITTGLTGLTLAEDGLDFDLPPSPLIIPAGQTTATLNIPILTDAIAGEGTESFVIQFDNTCNCDDNRDTFFIIDAVPLDVAIVAPPVTCPGEDYLLEAVVTGGNGTYSYDWADGSTGSTVPLTASDRDTLIRVEVNDECGLMGMGSVFIPGSTAGASIVTGDYSLCGIDSVGVPITLTGQAPYDVYFNFVDPVFGITFVSNFTITGDTVLFFSRPVIFSIDSLIDANGCRGPATGVATVIRGAIGATAVVDQPDCVGDLGSISVALNGDPSTYTIEWQDDASITTTTRTDLPAGPYALVVTQTDMMACSDTLRYTIIAPEPLAVSISPDDPDVCIGEQITFAPIISGGAAPYIIDWDTDPAADSLLTVTTLANTTVYTVTVTDDCGSSVSATVTTEAPPFDIRLGGDFSSCDGSPPAGLPITVTGPAGDYDLTYHLGDPGDPTTVTLQPGVQTLAIDPTAGLTVLSFTNAQGCEGMVDNQPLNVISPMLQIVVSVDDVSCAGAMDGRIELLDPGAVPVTITWSDSGPDASVRTGLNGGVYGVTVADASESSCFVTDVVVIAEPPAIGLTLDSIVDQTCFSEGSVTVSGSGGTGDLSFAWSSGATLNTTGPVGAGNYTITLTDTNGCDTMSSYTVADLRTTPDASISAVDTELTCTLLSIQLTAPAASPGIAYEWSFNGTVAANGPTFEATRGGVYTLRATDTSNGCFTEEVITVTESPDIFTLTVEEEYALTCLANSQDLLVTSEDPAALSYEWRFAGAVVGTERVLPGVTVAGAYTVVATRTSDGCQRMTTVEVADRTGAPAVTATASPMELNCIMSEAELRIAGGSGLVYDWSTQDGAILSSPTAPVIMTGQPGTYVAVVTDPETGCDTTLSISVIVNMEELILDTGGELPFPCEGGSVQLSATVQPDLPGSFFTWRRLDGTVVATTLTTQVSRTGTYILEGVHPTTGCVSFDTLMVINTGPTAVDYRLTPIPCEDIGGRLRIDSVVGGTAPYTFTSTAGRPDTSGTGFINLPVGTSVLTVTDALGCTLRDTFFVFEGEGFTGEAEDIEVSIGESVELGVTTNRGDGAQVQYEWVNLPDTLACRDCPNPTLTPRESFIAQVTVTDEDGCVLVLRQNVFVRDREFVYLPNAFSPGSVDGTNDVFTVFGDAEFVERVTSLRVYDRWGAEVFSNGDFGVNDLGAGWDGLVGGRALPAGVYVYVAEVVVVGRGSVRYSGSVTLLR